LPRDVEDVAKTHVLALDPKVPGNERYLYHAKELLQGDAVANFIREKYPQLRDRVPAGDKNATIPPNLIKTDISKFEAVFGAEWKGWEASVTAVVDDILKAKEEVVQQQPSGNSI
jgi:hypothetical protein